MSDDDIEASKAPLMDHLIELRSRLIKALLGFGIAFIFCFFFAKQIYNVLVWPFVWSPVPKIRKFIYTALLEYFLTQLKLHVRRRIISFPDRGDARSTSSWRPAFTSMNAAPFCRIWWRRRSSSCSVRCWFISSCCRCWYDFRSVCSSPRAGNRADPVAAEGRRIPVG